jgi:magnesium transporter
MLEIFKTTSLGLERQDEISAGCWINVINPSKEEITRIENLDVPLDFITYSLDIDERPRTEREDNGTLLILLKIPYFAGKDVDVPYTTVPLGIILTNDCIITIGKVKNEVINKLTSTKAIRDLSTRKRNRFVLRILLLTATTYLAYLHEINKTVDILEDQLTLSMKNIHVLELLKYQKSLVYFTTALKSNELMLERLQRTQIFQMFEEDKDLLDDVIIENQQAMEMTSIYSNILSSMMDAFASIISNNLNVVMKFLASITIVLSIPAILTGYFGMNVTLPFQNNPYAYMIIIGLGLAISALVVYIFIKKDWF